LLLFWYCLLFLKAFPFLIKINSDFLRHKSSALCLFVIVTWFYIFFNFFKSLLPSIFEKTIQSGFGKQRKQSLISFILSLFFCLELHDCYCFTVYLISVSKPNQEGREWCYGLNNNFTIYVFLTLAILPRSCDDIHRQKTFVLYLEFSLFHPCLFTFTSFYCSIVLFSF